MAAMSSGPLRVLHIHFGRNGGAERFFINLAGALEKRAVEQRFVIRPGRAWREEIEELGDIVENHYRRFSPSGALLRMRMHGMVREWRPNAIMAWMPRAAGLIPDWPGAMKFARLGDYPKNLKPFARCDALVGNQPGIVGRCRALGWAGPVHMITNFPREVTPHPVSRADLDTPENAFVISGAARFVPEKGLDRLIRAAARLPDAWLWLLGSGPERRALEELAREAGIADRTRFTGWVRDSIHYIAATNVFAMTSRHEPLGNVVLESWQAGIPVIATRSEGPSWYMTDEVDGLLVDIDDVDGLFQALTRLRNEPSLVRTVAAGGRKRLEDLFNQDRIVDQYMDLFAGKPSIAGS